MKALKLFVFDFDGTALGGHEPYNKFPKDFAEFLDDLYSKGILWGTNTTWAPPEQYEVIKSSGVRSEPAFLAGQTGRLLSTIVNGKLLFDTSYERKILVKDKKFRRTNQKLVDKVMLYIIKSALFERFSYNDFNQNIITFAIKRGKVEKGLRVIQPLIDSGSFYFFDSPSKASNVLLPTHMNKGDILKTMQKRLGITSEETAIAGDARNDIHMFDSRLARCMVCPDNAHSTIKRIVKKCPAGVISPKRYSWGVIDAMDILLSKGA